MTDLLLHIGVSNLCLSLLLAIAAWAVQANGKWPLVAHLLWLLVLAKLVTPPLFTIPVIAVPGLPEAAAHGLPTGSLATAAAATTVGTASSVNPANAAAQTGLILLWLVGSACVLAWSLVRIYRFNRLLGMATEEAPRELQRTATEIGHSLGLRRIPIIYTTSAHLSPMVWWVGGAVRVVLPAALPHEMEPGQLRLILAHELAHVRRRDHLVRWLEWLACVGFWWNPVAWWARRNVRVNEEVCCDALVLRSLKPTPHSYANSLLSVVEFLSTPALRPPAMASAINGGGFLERRLQMIVTSHAVAKTPRWLHAFLLVFAVALLPLGVAYAQDPDRAAVGKRLRAAVEAGELTAEQARSMMGSLQKAAGAERPRGSKRAKVYLTDLRKKLGTAVRAGEMTREEAGKKYRAGEERMKKRMAAATRQAAKPKPDAGRARARIYLAKVKKDLGAAIKAGRDQQRSRGHALSGGREGRQDTNGRSPPAHRGVQPEAAEPERPGARRTRTPQGGRRRQDLEGGRPGSHGRDAQSHGQERRA